MTDFHALCAELVDALDQCQRLCGDQPESFLVWKARAALVQPEPQGPKLIYRYNPATIAECGGPCEQGPQYCDCGQIKGEPMPQGPTDEEIEAAARVIYGSMRFDRIGYTEPWVERGNSFAQDEARRCARAVLARWGRPAKPKPQEVEPMDKELLGIEDLEAAWNAQADAFNSWDELGLDEIVCWAQQQALARWGRPAVEPVPVSERLPGPKDCDAEGRCWLLYRSASVNRTPTWSLVHRRLILDAPYTHWLPHWALPVPRSEPSNP